MTGPIANGSTTDDSQPEIRGTAEPGSTVTIFDGGEALGQMTADDTGNWSFTPETPLAEGQHSLTAVATNAVGSSEPSGQFGFSVVPSGHQDVDLGDALNGGVNAPIHFVQYGWDRHDLTFKDGVLHIGAHTTSWKQEATSNLHIQPWNANTGYPTSAAIDFANVNAAYNHALKVFVRPVGKITGEIMSMVVTLPKGASHYELEAPEGYELVRIEIVFDNASPGFDITALSYDIGYQFPIGLSDVFVDEVAVSEIQDTEDSSDTDAMAHANADVPADSGVDDEKPSDSDSAPDSDEQSVGATLAESPETVLDLQGIEYSTREDGDIHTEDGVDVLTLTGSGLVLDLANVEEKLSSIEVFDITGTGNNTLKLSLGDVLELGAEDLFIADGHTQLMVKGDASDKVELSDLLPDGEDLGDWVQESGTATVGGVEYDVFYHAGLNAELLVQHGVETTLNNH